MPQEFARVGVTAQRRGLLVKKSYVDASAVDAAVEYGAWVCMGASAFLAPDGFGLITDSFRENLWTPDSTANVIQALERTEQRIDSDADPPWLSLVRPHRMQSHMMQVEVSRLSQPPVQMLWTALTAEAAFWGLLNEDRLKREFERWQEVCIMLNLHRRALPFAFSSFQDFTEDCNRLCIRVPVRYGHRRIPSGPADVQGLAATHTATQRVSPLIVTLIASCRLLL